MTTGRRGALKAFVLVAVLLTAILGGCTSTADQAPSGPQLANEPDYKGYLDDTDNYDYTHDMRGQEEVTIEVGSKGNMGDYGFGPAAVAVSPGTTVTWVWTGNGGMHNVVADEGTFNSGQPVAGEGTTFTYTFDKPGVYRYACTPHEAMGMKGAIFVTADQASDSSNNADSEPVEYAMYRHLELEY